MSKYKYGMTRVGDTDCKFYVKKKEFLFYHTIVKFDNSNDLWDYIRELKATGNDVEYDFK